MIRYAKNRGFVLKPNQMKKHRLLFIASLLAATVSNAQNTFPSSGNVGIGTTSPSSLLHVLRNTTSTDPVFAIEDDYTSGYTQMEFRGTQRLFRLGVGNHSASTPYQNQFFIVDVNVGKPRLLINSDGTVTIGSTLYDGGGKLTIYPSSANNSGLQLLRLTSSSTTTTANGKVLTVDDDGNVVLVNDGGTNSWSLSGNASINPSTQFLGTTQFQDFVMRTNNLERMRLTALGNLRLGLGTDRGKKLQVNGTSYFSSAVGIGTDSINDPDFKLFVADGVRTRKVKVDVSAWPDYVFESGYALPALEDLEVYINQHKHLPGINSAAEVAAEGLDLGSGQAALLKKIEELTLYVIQLNKQLQEQGAELSRLKNEERLPLSR